MQSGQTQPLSRLGIVSAKPQQSKAPHVWPPPRHTLSLGGFCLSILLLLLIPTIALSQALPARTSAGRRTANLNRRNNSDRPKSVKDWVRQLKDEDPDTRLNAVQQLGDSAHPDAIDPLIQATADPDIRIKVKAVDYLGNLRATDSIPILVQQLYLRDVDMGVKQKVLVALGKIGDPQAGEPIAEFLKRNLESGLRGTAIFALAEAGGLEVIASLQRVAEEVDDPLIQGLAVIAAEEIRQRLSPTSIEVEPTYIRMLRLQEEAMTKGKKKK